MSTTVPASPDVSIGNMSATIFATISDVLWFAPAAQRRPLTWTLDTCAYCGGGAEPVGLVEMAWGDDDGKVLRHGVHYLGCVERMAAAAAAWTSHDESRFVIVGG